MSVVAVSTKIWSGVGPVLRLSTVSLKMSSLTEITEDKDEREEFEDKDVSGELVLSMEEVCL